MEERTPPQGDQPPIGSATPPGVFGPPDASQPEPGPDPSAGGTDLPAQTQADLTGDEPEPRVENQPPPRAMQIPREESE